MQYFLGDDTEKKMYNAGAAIHDAIGLSKDQFFDNAYNCKPLGEFLFDEDRAPLANAIDRDVFIDAYDEIFDSFLVAGSFESYIAIFKRIFGDDVDVQFTVPGPGLLNIDIQATGFETHLFKADSIVDNAYVYDQMVDDVGDNLVFDNVKGFQTEYEVQQMLYEFVPSGIFAEITLTIL